MKNLLLTMALLLAACPLALAQAPGEGDKPPDPAAYKAAMDEGRKAEAKKEWIAAADAYRRALEAKPGDKDAAAASEKMSKKTGVVPKGIEGSFSLPTSAKDRFGNPVSVRNGKLADPATGWAYEIRMNVAGEPQWPETQPPPQVWMEFVFVPAGSFDMGSPESEALRDVNEGPVHRVAISKPFYIAKYEVTQGQWKAVEGDEIARFKEAGKDAPIEQVSWEDAKDFCSKKGLALPTEAQWEYACRAGTMTPFNLGRTVTVEQVNYHGDYPYGGSPKGINRATTVRVGSFPPNAWGLYDTHGNVWEWCEDVFVRDFYAKPEASKPDPVCTSGATLRSFRGGSWVGYAWYCRSASRDGQEPGIRGGYLGFRPIKVLP
jgi:formylglycine-generating enzyme required for sulfatase activity